MIGRAGAVLRVVRPIAGAVREADQLTEGGGRIHLLPGDPASVARLRGILDGDVTAPDEDALAILPVRRDTDLSIGAPALVARRRQGGGAVAMLIGDAGERAELEERMLRGRRLEMSNIVHVPSLDGDDGRDAGIAAILPHLGEDAVASGWRYPGLRKPVGQDLIVRRAKQSAAIGALPFPGVDMPGITLIQIRLVAELESMYGYRFGPERAVEALGLFGAGFAWRAIARSAVGLVPGAGWAARGAVAYAATRAVGETTLARLESGHELVEGIPLEPLRPAFDRVAARLGLGTSNPPRSQS
ncbi:MAG TPA: DUF697 domain-containing protein [Miltoncostaeaceae bacterium]|nr:DUF697 domain-containing protein [Miltoncostaeaceae bacterium]